MRDLEIQRRENDLVVGTFGRGIYILDDYSALRTSGSALAESQLFPVRSPWLYVPGSLWKSDVAGAMGAEFFSAPNPPAGAVFTYYLENAVESRARQRRQREIEIEKEGGDTPYPTWDAIRTEDREVEAAVAVLVRDAEGRLVRQVTGDSKKGLHRTAWDLRLPPPDPIQLSETDSRKRPPVGPLVLPGDYTAQLAINRDGQLQSTGEPRAFTVKALENSPEITGDRRAHQTFLIRAASLQRAVKGSVQALTEMETRVEHLRAALVETPAAAEAEHAELQRIHLSLADLKAALAGDTSVSSRNESAPMSVATRSDQIYTPSVLSQAPVSAMLKQSYAIAASEFSTALELLRTLDQELRELETALDIKGAPWTPGRIPQWSEN